MTTREELDKMFDANTQNVIEHFEDWIKSDRKFMKDLLNEVSLLSTNLAVLLLMDNGKMLIPKDTYNAQIEKIHQMKWGYKFHSYPDEDGNMYLWIEEKSELDK
jgi:hypothetical protein